MQWTGSMKHECGGVSDGKRAQLKRATDRCPCALLSRRGCVSCTAIRCSAAASLIDSHSLSTDSHRDELAPAALTLRLRSCIHSARRLSQAAAGGVWRVWRSRKPVSNWSSGESAATIGEMEKKIKKNKKDGKHGLHFSQPKRPQRIRSTRFERTAAVCFPIH